MKERKKWNLPLFFERTGMGEETQSDSRHVKSNVNSKDLTPNAPDGLVRSHGAEYIIMVVTYGLNVHACL